VRWGAGAEPGRPVTLEFAVAPTGEHWSHVVVTVPEPAENPLAAIEDFAGPLGARMTAVTARSVFFNPPRTRRDDVVLGGWLGMLLLLLTVVAATRHIPADDEDMSGREAVMEFVVPFVAAAFAAGVAGGLGVRLRGRWYEVPVLGLALGWAASLAVLDIWFVETDTGEGAGSGSSNFALGIGAALCAVPLALVVLTGVVAGRTPVALTRLVQRLRR
jgi:hypothetical protein